MSVLWACTPYFQKTDACLSQGAVYVQNILESFLRSPSHAMEEAVTQFIFGSVRIATQTGFQIAQ